MSATAHLPTPRREPAMLVLMGVMAFSVLVPHVVAGSVAVGLDDLLALVLVVTMPFVAVRQSRARWALPVLFIGFLWVVIFFHGVVLGLAAGFDILGRVSAPTEMWQYIKRMVFFFVALAAARQSPEGALTAYKLIFSAALASGVIGLIQIPDMPLSQAVASIYGRTDAQLEELIGKGLDVRRVYGVAGHPVAWGGFCVFMVALAIPWLLQGAATRVREHRSWRLAGALLFGIALANLLFSASRAAAAAFIAVVLCAGLAECAFRHGGWSTVRRWMLLFVGLLSCAVLLVMDRLALLFVRFVVLSESGGGGRVEQVLSGLELLQSHGAWLSGVGNAVQRTYGVSHGVEVEPVYLLVNYGIFGAGARYFLLIIIAYIGVRLARMRDVESSSVGIATLLAVVGYSVFAMGYFFFQELYVGVTPWLLFGVAAGTYQRCMSVENVTARVGASENTSGLRQGTA